MFNDKHKLDLHGVKHEAVPSMLDEFIWLHMTKKSSAVTVVTGKSDEMKKIVNDVLYEYGLSVNEGMWNTGVLYVNLG